MSTNSAAEPGAAAGFMAAFGLGTLPAVLSLGTAAAALWRRVDAGRLRGASGVVLGLCGLWIIVAPLWMQATQIPAAPMCH